MVMTPTQSEPLLLVDSDEPGRSSMIDLLRNERYAVTALGSGTLALEYLALGTMPCLIMFVLRDGDDSVSFRRAQQDNKTWSAVPTVLFTAEAGPVSAAVTHTMLTLVGRHCVPVH